MRQMRTTNWAVAVLTAVAMLHGGRASGDVTSDQAAAIINYPYITVDTARGIDTVVQLSNASTTGGVYAHCIYENANSHCSNAPATICSSAADCPAGGACEPAWTVTDFLIRLTTRQPLAWRANLGLFSLPCDVPTCGEANEGFIPPVAEDPFTGNLLCFAVDGNDAPIDSNVLKGEATIERFDPSQSLLDVAKYNAVGLQAIPGANNGDQDLVLGGPAPEYKGCPNVVILNHFFDGALEPVASASTIYTKLSVVPCRQDPLVEVRPVATTLQFLVFNEFEQRFSTSRQVDCQQVLRLSNIDTPNAQSSIFHYAVAGTLTGQTRITPLPGGALAVAIEEHEDSGGRIMSAAFNTHEQGERENADIIGRQPIICGDGRVEGTEQCDDGNVLDGDCCSANCQLDPAGQPCGDDGNLCTADQCDGDGTCLHTPVECADDGNVCNGPETCDPGTGQCVSGPAPAPGTDCDLDANLCTTDQCDGNGTCVALGNAAAGSDCDDGVFCNGADTCGGDQNGGNGICGHAGDPCQTGGECNNLCNEAAADCFVPADTPCTDDDRVCTADVCDGQGSCTHPELPPEQCPKGYAILGWPAGANINALLTRAARAGGRVCTETIRLRRQSRIEASAIAPLAAGTALTFSDGTEVTGDLVTGGGSISGLATVLHPNPPIIDATQTAQQLVDCASAANKADTRRTTLTALAATLTFTNPIVVGTGGSFPVTLSDGQNVIVVPAITVKPYGTLRLVGSGATTEVIVRVPGQLKLRRGAQVELTGGLTPQQVVFVVDGAILVRAKAHLRGAAYGQSTTYVGWDATVDGQLVGADDIQVRKEAEVNLHPFAGW